MANKIDLIQVYGPESQDGLRDTYDHWAGAYDDQMVGDFGYVGHELMVAFLRDHLNKDDRILDAGAKVVIIADGGYRKGEAFGLRQTRSGSAQVTPKQFFFCSAARWPVLW